MGEKHQQTAVEFIKHKIQILNWTVLLIIFVVLLLIVRFMHDFVNYIPMRSVVTMLTIMAGLAIISIYLARTASGKAITAIDSYMTKLSTLLKTSKDIHEIGHSDMLLEKILDSAMGLTKAEGGSLMFLEGDELIFKLVKGSKAKELTGQAIPKSKGIAGWVVDTGIALRVNDAKSDSRFYPDVDRITSFETRSVLCVPLKVKTEMIGALELVNKQGGAFSSEDEGLLCYFAGQAALSLEKTKFYEDERNYEIHLTNILIDAAENLSEKRGHAKHVARYALLLAKTLNLSEDVRKRLYRASMLHDIGFLKIRLDKVTSTDDYKSHSHLAYEMLRPINFYADIVPIILHHHERYDGRGYPSGLTGEDIPLESRIIAIAEAFDTMVSEESYKKVGKVITAGIIPSVVNFTHAVEELRRNAGTQFDPQLVETFLQAITEEDMA